MKLTFTEVLDCGSGSSPSIIHDKSNKMQLIYIEDGLAKGRSFYPRSGNYGEVSWKENGQISPDAEISKPSFKKVSHFGAYGFWCAENERYKSHNFVVYMMEKELSELFITGCITKPANNEISSISFTAHNANGALLNRSRAYLTPGVMVEVYLALGDSPEMRLGQFYIDSATTKYPDGEVSVNARNAVGKLLKEQTFDEDNNFTKEYVRDNLIDVLERFEVQDFFVADNQRKGKLQFDRDTTLLDGLQSVADTLGWRLHEVDGIIGLAPRDDGRFDHESVYIFTRDHDCWEYDVTYDDSEAAAKVCVYNEGRVEELQRKTDRLKELMDDDDKSESEVERIQDLVSEINEMFPNMELAYNAGTDSLNMKIADISDWFEAKPITVYKDVLSNPWWVQPSHRTQYVKVAEGTTEEEITAIANELVDSLERTGRTETFVGLFKPFLSVGDEVHILDEKGIYETIGTITDLKHNFGQDGFYTQFTVDSGGRKGKERLGDLLQKATQKPQETKVNIY